MRRGAAPTKLILGFFAAVLGSTVASGCDDGGKKDDQEDSYGPKESKPADPIDEADALAEITRSQCERLVACGCLDEMSIMGCTDNVKAAWDEVQRINDMAGGTYRAQNVGELVSLVDQMSCFGDGNHPYDLYSKHTRALLGMFPIYGGDAKEGDPCWKLSQTNLMHIDTCADGFQCSMLDGTGFQGTCAARTTGMGQVPLALGDECTSNGAVRGWCPDGATCDFATSKCVERPTVGEACIFGTGLSMSGELSAPSYDYGCAFGHYCELSSGTCELLPGPDEACIADTGSANASEPSCAIGLRCSSANVCVFPTAQLGEACSSDDDCTASGQCMGGTCMPIDSSVCLL